MVWVSHPNPPNAKYVCTWIPFTKDNSNSWPQELDELGSSNLTLGWNGEGYMQLG